MDEDEPKVVTKEEFTRELARELDRDPEELRAAAREIEIPPPWELVPEGAADDS